MTCMDKIKKQLKWETGSQPEKVCPECGRKMVFRVSGKKRESGRLFRDVRGSCRHCGTLFHFPWWRG